MAKRPNNLETVLLAIELLKRIRRDRLVSAPELQKQLHAAGYARDLRTIQRQLEELSQHFDIERREESRPYQYKWKPMAQGFSAPGLNEHESLLLALSERHLSSLLPVHLIESMKGFFEQAHKNLSAHDGPVKKGAQWLKKVRIVSTTQPLLPPKLAPGVFEQVSQALYDDRWLAIGYVNASGKATSAEVMPLGLALQGVRMYLVCRFNGHDNERSLAMHRIQSAKASTLAFVRPQGFDLEKYDDDGRFGFGEGKHIKVKFTITRNAGQHLLESPLSDDQNVVANPDTYEITATVVESSHLVKWLRGFGKEISRVTPARLLK